MRAVPLILCLFLTACVTQEKPRGCQPLPEPNGNSIASQRAYTLLVISMYATCAAQIEAVRKEKP